MFSGKQKKSDFLGSVEEPKKKEKKKSKIKQQDDTEVDFFEV